MISVKAPATSANLCCGLDTFGLAVSMHNTFTFERSERFTYDGRKVDMDELNNLVIKSYMIASEHLGKEPVPVKVEGSSSIPSARGLGSSATCAVAGIIAAYRIHDVKVNLKDVFNVASVIEDHPDNVAACIFGGMTLSYHTDEGYRYYRIFPDRKYRLCAFIPRFRLRTDRSRSVLPETYPREDAVFNIQRASLLALSIQSGKTSFVGDALDDRLHERYRKDLINGYDDIVDIAHSHGFIGTYLSGAGPTVMGLYSGRMDFDAVRKDLRKLKHRYDLKPLNIDMKGVSF